MRTDVNCNHCGVAYILDAAFAGNALPCPSCGAADGLVVPVDPRPSAAPVAAATPTEQPTAPQNETDEVVCPRCKLHFVPRRGAAEEPQHLRQTVLVVEDMDYFREIAAEALASRFEVKTAANVADARRILSAGGIELMVLDLTLDGGDHGALLLRDMQVKPCPILIYADQDESEMYGDSWEELRQLGADDIVMKGMNAGESLVRKACSLLGQPWDEDG